jgi:hypothetical protein
MIKKTFAVAAATAGVLAATVAPSSAMSVQSGAYFQNTGPLTCTGQVLGDGDGGTLYVKVSGAEIRPSDQHFRTYVLKTRIIAQEKTYSGVWKTVKISAPATGHLGAAVNVDGSNVAPFEWGTDTNPRLAITVKGFDDLFRAKVVSRLFDDEGVLIRVLRTYQGQCRL